MAVSQTHFRSISLPSRLHPINSTGVLADFEILKSPFTSEAIQSRLLTLAQLYNSVQQQSLHHQHPKSIEHSLETSVELLDCCNTIREMVQMMKDNVQALQSALRRKGSVSSIQNDVSSYFSFTKKTNKCIAKTLKTLKNLENKNASNVSVSVFEELSGTTIAIFKCTLVLFSSSPVKSGGWNLVSRLILNKSVKDHSVISEVGCVDLALNDLQRSIRSSDSQVFDRKIVQKSLQNLESCVDGIEAGLETLFRRLLQSRVALLNIVADC